MLNLDFKGNFDGLAAITDTKSLFTFDKQPRLLLKRVDSLSQALAAGGFLAYHTSTKSYSFFIGQTARSVAKSEVWLFDHFLAWSFQPGDGASTTLDFTSLLVPSGETAFRVNVWPRKTSSNDFVVLAIVSNAAAGYGCNAGLYYDADFYKNYPAGFVVRNAANDPFLRWPIPDPANPVDGPVRVPYLPPRENPNQVMNWAEDRGSVVVNIAIPKTRNEIIKEQRLQITEGSGKGKKYIDAAIDNALKKPDADRKSVV